MLTEWFHLYSYGIIVMAILNACLVCKLSPLLYSHKWQTKRTSLLFNQFMFGVFWPITIILTGLYIFFLFLVSPLDPEGIAMALGEAIREADDHIKNKERKLLRELSKINQSNVDIE